MKIDRGNQVLGENLPQRHFVHHLNILCVVRVITICLIVFYCFRYVLLYVYCIGYVLLYVYVLLYCVYFLLYYVRYYFMFSFYCIVLFTFCCIMLYYCIVLLYRFCLYKGRTTATGCKPNCSK
jgi:hypothetical protein